MRTPLTWRGVAINVLSRNVFHVKRSEPGPDVSHETGRRLDVLHSLALLTALALAACRTEGEPATTTSPPQSAGPWQVDSAQLLVDMDQRRHDTALAAGFLRGDDEHRSQAARALALIGSDGALSLLQRGLSDRSPEVRRAVSFGLSLGQFPVDAWLGALAVETDPATRARMLLDLGRVLPSRRAGELIRALESDPPAAACTGIKHVLQRDPLLPDAALSRLQRMAADRDPAVAVACLQALATLGPESLRAVSPGLLEQAALGLELPDANQRLAWLRLIPRLTAAPQSLIVRATRDPSPLVAAIAFELLATYGPAALPNFAQAFATRLQVVLSGEGAAADPSVLHAALDAAPLLGDSVEVTQWASSVVERATFPAGAPTPPAVAALHCSASRAFDRIRKWPSRSVECGAAKRPAWVGQSAAAEVLGNASGSDALRATQLRRLFEQGDWHVRAAVAVAASSLTPDHALPILLAGISDDHPAVRSAAVSTLARLTPRLRQTGQPLPDRLLAAMREAFSQFHVTQHVEGLRAWLQVVRLARLRSELSGVTVLARSGIAPLRSDALALLSEWGHPPPNTVEPLPEPISRDQLRDLKPTSITLTAPATDLAITLDPQHAPVNVARMIQWLKDHPSLEVGAWRPGRHILLTEASGTATSAWRSEESTAPVTRGTIVIPQVQRDALQASMLILLADAPELDERVTVVGRVDQSSLSQLDQLLLGDLISARTP